MDILVDQYMQEREDSEPTNFDKLNDLAAINLDVFFEGKSLLIDICAADIDENTLEIQPRDIREINIEICGVWSKLDDKFLTKYPETTKELMTEINKALSAYLNKNGIY